MQKKIGLIIVGDEILSGRRQDKHLSHVISMLGERDLALDWCRIIGDDMQQQIDLYKDTLSREDIVFSTGGIGATPDDLTRQAAALASGFACEYHPEGIQIIEARFGADINDDRRRLVEFPRGSRLIPNPVNNIPGFSLYDHHFVPGFPQMAWPMMEWVLDKYYVNILPNKKAELAITVFALEGQLIPLMQDINTKYPQVSVFSLPKIIEKQDKKQLIMGVKGLKGTINEAMTYMQKELAKMHIEWAEIE